MGTSHTLNSMSFPHSWTAPGWRWSPTAVH